MGLKLARTYYGGVLTHYNPLWQHIGLAFQKEFLAKSGDRGFDEELYVAARMHSDGIAEDELVQFVRQRPERLLVVEGWAGIGKTTLLRHTFEASISTPEWRVVWVDVETEVSAHGASEVVSEVLGLIAAHLERELVTSDAGLVQWYDFFLAHSPDRSGQLRLLRRRLAEEGLTRAVEDMLLPVVAAPNNILDLIRLKTRFLWEVQRRRVVVVIDNSDHLSDGCLAALARLGIQLAEGRRSPQSTRAAQEAVLAETPSVIVALRPISLRKVSFGTTPIWRGMVTPPDITSVLDRRLKKFLAEYEGTVLRSTRVRDRSTGREVAVVPDPDVTRGEPSATAREWIVKAAGALTVDSHYGRLCLTVQQMTNYSTRQTLAAVAGYIASGHVQFDMLLRAMKGEQVSFSPRKTFAALMLGANSIYSSSGHRCSWVHNLFNEGGNDQVAVVLRLRTMKILPGPDSENGLASAEVVDALSSLFGYQAERCRRTIESLVRLGLVRDAGSSHLLLTPAGECYLQRLGRDFEYLQHVAVDVPVDARYVLECVERDEPAYTRFRRVLMVGQWIREIEAHELAAVLRSGQLDRYRCLYGSDTISETIGGCLVSVEPHLPRGSVPESQWRELAYEAVRLRDESDLTPLLAAVKERAASA